jgi:beta-glucanase (GH16 family)
MIAKVADGKLTITAAKIDGQVRSIRVNTTEAWTYGYFEARLKLPKGKGTWPAFWMMPKNFTGWPKDGEIDIMEHVGYHQDYVSSSIHCTAYVHSNGTQKTKEIYLKGATDEFHVYALEWTPEYIKSYVDGEQLFYYKPETYGERNYNTWPFDNPFYLKLNLAWGGNWGGAMGIDETCLPAVYEIDYVRVFQIPE